jgi:hypothetical protein
MIYYRLMLRDGGSVVIDAAAARLLLKQGKVISVKSVGSASPLYPRRDMRPAAGANYLTK